jgi:ribosomal-protein-alanine N-acetyltransferase
MTRVRPIETADLPRLWTIQNAALSEGLPELLAAAGDGSILGLVVEDPDVVGYVLAVGDGTVAYVPELAVLPDCQGQGLGSELLDALLSRLDAEGYGTVRLTARADDQRLRSFYESHGFAVVDRLDDYYETADGLEFARSP